MQVKAKANWQQSFFHKNALQGFSLKGVLLRILICNGVLINLILPVYVYNHHSLLRGLGPFTQVGSGPVGNYIHRLSAAQLDYYREKGYFSDSIQELAVGLTDKNSGSHSYRILSPMVPAQELKEPVPATPAAEIVFMLAQAKRPYMGSSIVVVHTTQKGIKKDKSETLLNYAKCGTKSWTTLPYTLPTLKGGKIQCPPGSHLGNSWTWTWEK